MIQPYLRKVWYLLMILCDAIDQSSAETNIFFIDACREGVKLSAKAGYKSGLQLAQWSRGEITKALKRRSVIVFGCATGQYCQYVKDGNGFSLFSKALSGVLDPQFPASTIGDVLEETQKRLDKISCGP